MKKILLTLMAIFAFGLQNINAQDAPLKIVTNHPDFNIKVKRCAASGKTVVLDLILTNEGANDVETVEVKGGRGYSEAYDNEGNIYQGNKIKVKVANRNEYSEYGTGDFSIPTGVPMKVSINIEGVPQAAESIARLKLVVHCNVWGLNNLKPVRFSNIPIARN
jgi:hypothetical protein